MTPAEWERLCDGCGLCCCYRSDGTRGAETGESKERYACALLVPATGQCGDYRHRKARVPDCFQITPRNIESATWLPASCAYRRLAAGKPLPRWHHLVSGDRETVHEAGRSVRGIAFQTNQD